jgi:hypothetical protein
MIEDNDKQQNLRPYGPFRRVACSTQDPLSLLFRLSMLWKQERTRST